jgi:hypothetical protein
MKNTNTNTDNNNQYEPDFDCLQYYEIQEELLRATYECFAVGEHIVLCVTESDYCYWDFDYCVKQYKDYHLDDGIDFEDMECISEDDILQDLWLVGKIESDNIMDCFWEAEMTDLCGDDSTFYTEYRDYFSEHEYDNYSKYLCYQTESNFYYCKKEDCEGCKHFSKGKEVNYEYSMWEKYVQPLELDSK